MKTPHKHAELIKAWADGAEIEFYSEPAKQWISTAFPNWFPDNKFRIKPEPKPDHVYYGVFEMDGSVHIDSCFTKLNDAGDELKLTFSGETGKLKSAEVL